MRLSVKKIYLNYENMEGVDIPLQFIGRFRLNNITQRIARWHIGAPDLYSCVDKFFIEIDRSFDKEKLGQAENYKAITSISIEFEDGEEARYLVSWGDEDFINTCQLTRFNKHGDLFIAISEDPDWNENAMDEERINADNFKLRTVPEEISPPNPYELEREIEKLQRELATTRQNLKYVIDRANENGVQIDEGEMCNQHKLIPIEELGLSIRSFNCLTRHGVSCAGDLTQMRLKDLAKVRNLGHKSREEVVNRLHELGLDLLPDED